MRIGRFVVFASAALLFGLLAGCGGDKSDGSMKAVEEAGEQVEDAATEAVEEVKKRTPDELKTKINEVTEQIMGKEAELKELGAKLEELSPSDMMGDSAKALKEKSETLNEEIGSLKEQLTEYTDEMMGGE